MNIALAALMLALLVSIGLNYSLWKKAEQQPDLIGLAVSLEWRARGAHDLHRDQLDHIADILRRGARHIDIARGLPTTLDAPRKLSATQLGKLHNIPASAIQERLVQLGYMVKTTGVHEFTDLGLRAGGVFLKRDAHDEGYMAWPVDIPLTTGR